MPLELNETARSRSRPSILIGQIDVTRSLKSYTLAEDNRMPLAEVRLGVSDLPDIDYFAPLTIGRQVEGGEGTAQFGGTIVSAKRVDDDLVLNAYGVSQMRETNASPWATSNVPALDLIYMLARTSGFADEQIQVEIAQPLPLETFEVVQPVNGCTVNRPVWVDSLVRLIPATGAELERFKKNQPTEFFASHFEQGRALAVTYVVGLRRMFEAEEIGAARIANAASLLTTRLRFGSAFGVDGNLRSFVREQARATIRPAKAAMVTGLNSSRSWIRDRSTMQSLVTWDGSELSDISRSASPLDARAQSSHRALARAANEELEPEDRLAAIWEALEYYAATVSTPSLFTKTELRKLRKRANEGLSPAQSERLKFSLDQLNSSSLVARLLFRAETDGAWLSMPERTLLRRMRDYRNDAVHGRESHVPSREDLEWFVSVVARLLVFAADPQSTTAAGAF